MGDRRLRHRPLGKGRLRHGCPWDRRLGNCCLRHRWHLHVRNWITNDRGRLIVLAAIDALDAPPLADDAKEGRFEMTPFGPRSKEE